ncbi:hypothetical protein BDV96DRAFT_616441 [Lophiotrema nucula]|uniref:Transcription factor domain-containing protein n=1 Tax=Lophiotrema nucula TaxID=690887 RepID=A0A6A5YMR8_9PLEO|nr:hypothetical protein BDV96DRAFT_616441 [Lophiotrema nucula]
MDGFGPTDTNHSLFLRLQENSADTEATDEDYDPSNCLSLDECGRIGVYGPMSALHGSSPTKDSTSCEKDVSAGLRNELVANAALQRQKEHALVQLQTLGGEPAELAMHLLDLHWNRQHHTVLLIYRPAILRDLVNGGPCCSDFLLNAIFAFRDSPSEAETTGRRFFLRCEQMLGEVLTSTFNARGLVSEGWLYTGYALRMVFDLGLHLDCKQSLYLGRPFTMQLRDAHVSLDFLDTLEENELHMWILKLIFHTASIAPPVSIATPIHSVSTFRQFCLLSTISARIVDRFYVLGATARNMASHLATPWTHAVTWPSIVPPNIINVLTTFNALVILLHRPFIFDGQLRGAEALALYAVYVARTIHARNTSSENSRHQEDVTALIASLKCLDEQTVPNSGVSNPAGIIRRLMAANGIPNTSG